MFSPIRRSILYFASARFVIAIPLKGQFGFNEERALLCAQRAPTGREPSKAYRRGCVKQQTRSRWPRARLKCLLVKGSAAAVKPYSGTRGREGGRANARIERLKDLSPMGARTARHAAVLCYNSMS